GLYFRPRRRASS
ncbi:zinc finger, C3HC4 type (RING finger) domain-containing protein, partial [Toxoplasma gondii TgCatPRC2]